MNKKNINLKLQAMKDGGKINREVMVTLFKKAKPGVKLSDLDKLAEELVLQRGAVPSFKGYNGFPNSICTNVGNGLIHGIPDDYKIKEGDILTIDQGVFFKGFHTDHALTKIINSGGEKGKTTAEDTEKKKAFLKIGQKALEKAIKAAVVGNKVGDISFAIETTIMDAGYFVVTSFVGHGVGEELHLDPQIPCFGDEGEGPKLYDGQTLAIEVMYTDKESDLPTLKDSWTIVAKDATLAALFEKTIMVRRENPLVLT